MGDTPSPSVVYFDPRKGEENFARLCQFLMTICGDILRVLLSHHIKPDDLRSQLDLNQSRLDRITNDVQFEDYWQELKSSVVEIEKNVIGSDKYEGWIDHLHDCDLNPTKAKEYVAQIRRIRGEVAIKRERIDMVENACIEIGEENDAKKARLDKVEKSVSDMKERLENAEQNQRAAKDEILREMRSFEIRVQQKISESKNTNSDRTTAAKIEGTEVSTTIKFNGVFSCTNMRPTIDNKCWLLFTYTPLYLLSDSNVVKKVDISIQYSYPVLINNIATNDKGEAVFISGQSVIAATQDGTVYKLFDVLPSLYPRLCFLHSGNYITVHGGVLHFEYLCIREYSRDGVLLRDVTTDIHLKSLDYDIRQNHNGDIVITGSNLNAFLAKRCSLLHVLAAEDFRVKHRVPLPELGVVVPYMNSRSELLYGHGKTIDLLTSAGQMVKTVYTTNRDTEIKNIASSGNGTVWILYGSDEVEIIKLEI